MKQRVQKLTTVSLLVTGAVAVLAAPRVPTRFSGLYRELEERVDSFDRIVSDKWNGERSDVLFSAELLTANSHRGQELLRGKTLTGVDLEMGRLADLGSRAVTVAVNFPILSEPFHEWRGKGDEYRRFLSFYREVASLARKRNLKLIVETGIIFPGPYSARSGFDVAAYYKKLGEEEFRKAKSDFVNVVVREMQPHYVNLGAEPDTEVQLTGKRITASASAFGDLMNYYVGRARSAGGERTQFAAGVGSWQRNGREYIQALSKTDLDIIDIHVYPVNANFLPNLIEFTDLAQRGGKKVGISEAWVLKQGSREFASKNAVSDPSIFARDTYSFWAPVDQKFLGALTKFAAWKQLVYLSPYWSTYFFSYLDFDASSNFGTAKLMEESVKGAVTSLVKGNVSETGDFWKCSTRFGPCLGGKSGK